MEHLIRGLRICPLILVVHGLLFIVTSPLMEYLLHGQSPSDPSIILMGISWVWLIILWLPGMVLCIPFNSLLWKLGLQQSGGWFSEPRLAGMIIVYLCWIALFAALSGVLRYRNDYVTRDARKL